MENDRHYAISGESVETSNREKSDKLLLNAIENERDERMKDTSDIVYQLTMLEMDNVATKYRLQQYETVLKYLIGLEFGLLILMIAIIWLT